MLRVLRVLCGEAFDKDTTIMPKKAKKIKLKTHRGAAKRFKRTKSGKFLRGSAFKQHILSSKTTKRKRGLRGTTTVADVDTPKLARMLPYK